MIKLVSPSYSQRKCGLFYAVVVSDFQLRLHKKLHHARIQKVSPGAWGGGGGQSLKTFYLVIHFTEGRGDTIYSRGRSLD